MSMIYSIPTTSMHMQTPIRPSARWTTKWAALWARKKWEWASTTHFTLAAHCNSENGRSFIKNTFYLSEKELESEFKVIPSQLSSDITFPASAQEWLVEFDFVAHSLCLFLRMPKQWALAIKVEMQHNAVIPHPGFKPVTQIAQ